MPKHDLIIEPGGAIPSEFEALIREKLGREQVERLQQHGGLIRLSVAAPYVTRGKDAPRTEIDEMFLKGLSAVRQDGQALEEKIRELRVEELKSICRALSIPIRSKATGHEIRAQILDFLRSGDKWQAIAES